MKNELEKFIAANRDQFDRKMPSPLVLGRILEDMNTKVEVKPKGILVPFRIIRMAAACFLLVAIGVAFWAFEKRPVTAVAVKISKPAAPQIKYQPKDVVKTTSETEIAKSRHKERKSVDAIDEDIAQRKRALLAKMQERTLRSEKQVMFAGLNNMESPATRITVASEAYKLKNMGNDIVDALVNTLNTDPNANVRLAALDALARFYREGYVRKKLVASLKKQQDPVVQIALINLLTRMKESGILSELDKMVNDESTQKPVKDCAYSGIITLRS